MPRSGNEVMRWKIKAKRVQGDIQKTWISGYGIYRSQNIQKP